MTSELRLINKKLIVRKLRFHRSGNNSNGFIIDVDNNASVNISIENMDKSCLKIKKALDYNSNLFLANLRENSTRMKDDCYIIPESSIYGFYSNSKNPIFYPLDDEFLIVKRNTEEFAADSGVLIPSAWANRDQSLTATVIGVHPDFNTKKHGLTIGDGIIIDKKAIGSSNLVQFDLSGREVIMLNVKFIIALADPSKVICTGYSS